LKIIKDTCDYIDEELCDAEKYIKRALEVKQDYPELAELFNMLSSEEMKHMQMLHNQVVKLIDNYRKTEGEPPASMLAVYDYLHQKFIDHAKEIKILQQMYMEK
jgi:Mn-containing catalase